MRVLLRYFRIKITNSKIVNWSEEEYEKLVLALRKFLENVSREAEETKEAAVILRKYIKEGKVTQEEEVAFKQQLFDVLKAMGIGIPFVLIPGASILLPVLAKISKKYKINLFPSSFNEKEK